jgi:uncharacterized membrane protein
MLEAARREEARETTGETTGERSQKGEITMMGLFGGFGWMGLFGMTMMLLFWVGVVVLAIVVARALFAQPGQDAHQSAAELLARRYAAGEISEAEYEQARQSLG